MTKIKIRLVKLVLFVINCTIAALYTLEEIQEMEKEFSKEELK